MRVVFRTDSGLLMGSGHLMRCLTLANELRSRGAKVIFISREYTGHIIHKLEEAGYLVHRLSAPQQETLTPTDNYATWLGISMLEDALETLTLLHEYLPDWLVVDHYGLDINWEANIRSVVNRIFVIDDIANRNHDCDLLLDQNYFGKNNGSRYINKVSDACICLFGPRYALLQPEYYELHSKIQTHIGQLRRVLIFFGGSDPHDQTSKVILALNSPELAHVAIDVVIGVNHPDPGGVSNLVSKRPNAILYDNLPSLASLMMNVDLVIGAGGTTTWERMCLGLPSLVISISENQQEFTHALSVDNYQISLSSGKWTTSTDWQQAIYKIMKQPALLKQVAKNAQSLVDGLGSKRVSRVLFGSKNFELTIRQAELSDEQLLFDWVNDPEVRRQSFQQESIDINQHSEWYARKLADTECLILIGEDEAGLPIGQVRFEMNTKLAEAIIGISIDTLVRGMGFSQVLLTKAIEYWFKIKPTFKLIAEVRIDNLRSEKLFTRLDFTPTHSKRAGAKRFEFLPRVINRSMSTEDSI